MSTVKRGRRTFLSILFFGEVCAILGLLSVGRMGLAPGFGEVLEQSEGNVSFVPEYDRTLRDVVISLSVKETTLDIQHNLLVALPEYSRIRLLVPGSSASAVAEYIGHQPYGHRVMLVPFDTQYQKKVQNYLVFPEKDTLIYAAPENGGIVPRGTVWAQDLFEVLDGPKGKALVISDTYKWLTSLGSESTLRVSSDNAFVGSLAGKSIDVRRIRTTFAGGNILVDTLRGIDIVFCGSDVIRKTRTVWKSTRDTVPTESEIATMLRSDLGADEVIVVGQGKVQPSLMFHLDQAMILLPNGVVGLTKVVDEELEGNAAEEVAAVKTFLAELRMILLRYDYRVIDLDTSAGNLLRHQHYANAIPYVDATTGERTILMPTFSDELRDGEIAQKNAETLASLGYRVVNVESEAHEKNGGIHCLINVLE